MITFACEKEDEIHIGNQPYQLRVKNDTPFSFDNVSIEIWESEHDYGPLQPGEISEYNSFTNAGYSDYPYIIVTVDGTDFQLGVQPIEKNQNPVLSDEVEIPPLTCVITINEYANNALDLHFEE